MILRAGNSENRNGVVVRESVTPPLGIILLYPAHTPPVRVLLKRFRRSTRPNAKGGWMRCFSKEDLFAARNSVPMRNVLAAMSGLPNKEIEGIFRFLCPVCGEFQTGINEKTNLARCFRCCRNYNAIELLMESQGISFVESVKLLLHSIKSKQALTSWRHQPKVPVRLKSSLMPVCGTTSKAEASTPARSFLSAASILERIIAS